MKLAALLFLVSCSQVVFPNMWKYAEVLCEKNGGISFVAGKTEDIFFEGDVLFVTVECKNGAVFTDAKMVK